MHARNLIFLYLLAAWIVFVAVRIEVLNAATGGVLPRTERAAQNKAMGGSGEWRAKWMTEELWREYYVRDAPGQSGARPLTPDERARMARDIAGANANYRLREFVSYFGCLLQYVLVAVVCWCGIRLTMEHHRRPLLSRLYALPVLIAAAAGVVAVQRGYFTSITIGI